MKIALLQADAITADIDANLETIRQGAIKAEADGAALLLTPELFVSGYAPVELRSWLAAGGDSETEQKLQALASDTEIAIAASFPLLREDGTATISAGLWAHDGSEVLRYDKVHLWGEDEKATFVAASDAPRSPSGTAGMSHSRSATTSSSLSRLGCSQATAPTSCSCRPPSTTMRTTCLI